MISLQLPEQPQSPTLLPTRKEQVYTYIVYKFILTKQKEKFKNIQATVTRLAATVHGELGALVKNICHMSEIVYL